ncbi:26S proteasome regulatory subunit rpn-1 [Fusarium oxysporum f. sp. albedinis]|nr:26S proteasome regulatory subunit rpn-1 [Fusarium oxysporum f. sp. albedinis]
MGAYKADEESGEYVRTVNKEEQHAAGIGHFGLMVIQRTSFHYASAGDYSLDDLAFPLALQPNSKMS